MNSNLADLLSITPNRYALAEENLPKFVRGQFKSFLRGGLAGGVVDGACSLAGYETGYFFASLGGVADAAQYTLRGINLHAIKREDPELYAAHQSESERLRLFK